MSTIENQGSVVSTEPKGDIIRKLITELTSLTKEDRNLAVRKAFQAVQLAQERRNRADKQYLIALRVLRRVVGGPTFLIDGQKYQIRVREGRPFICILDESKGGVAVA